MPGCSQEIKKSLFKRIAELLVQEAGLRKEDVLINLIEVARGKLVLRQQRGPVRHLSALAPGGFSFFQKSHFFVPRGAEACLTS